MLFFSQIFYFIFHLISDHRYITKCRGKKKKHFSSDHFPAAYIHPNIYEIWYAKMCFSCWQRNTPPYISLDCLHRSTESKAYCQYFYFDAEILPYITIGIMKYMTLVLQLGKTEAWNSGFLISFSEMRNLL